ncbi:hypothetical protein Kpho02_17380 [Kitasatospora phosalacinea]|uniref:Uncharacterized protein n=1 Tax=Kitasatospora phosalacinea TaxID=2065 RepID=A0A9W6UZB3_9ACTN|nr:hypothetical protein [Kitasatospora phosalacinea]GLW69439.1 hypothetical protein Kpho02_17380 [Kitasatospora phosalacinea]
MPSGDRTRFHVRLRPPTVPAPPEGLDPCDEGPYDHAVLTMIGCSDLAATDAAAEAGGFGAAWPFDVPYDLSAFLEDLDRLLTAFHDRTPYALDLYPQGVERTLTFTFPDRDLVAVHCASRTDWVPSPATEHHPYGRLHSQLTTLARTFATALETAGSRTAAHPPFPAWRAGRFAPTPVTLVHPDHLPRVLAARAPSRHHRVDTAGAASLDDLYDAVRRTLPLDPPLHGRTRSWDALDDSLFGGLHADDDRTPLITFTDLSALPPLELRFVQHEFTSLATTLATPAHTRDRPTHVQFLIGRTDT